MYVYVHVCVLLPVCECECKCPQMSEVLDFLEQALQTIVRPLCESLGLNWGPLQEHLNDEPSFQTQNPFFSIYF